MGPDHNTPPSPPPGETPLRHGPPPAEGLYDPVHEHDACGVGFVVDIKGRKSHAIVGQALQVLKNLAHRGACGCEVNTGDGAGILLQMPDAFLRSVAPAPLPPAGDYGAGLVFLPREAEHRATIERIFARIVAEEGQVLLGWRDVPTDDSPIGPSAVAVEPVFRQIFIASRASKGSRDAGSATPRDANSEARRRFERKLYVIRKRVEHAMDELGDQMPADAKKFFYVVSLSCNTLIYKGMLTAGQIEIMFPDLRNPLVESALALVHQRFSTNTFPAWPLAHPYRVIAHNGEINTLTGNINWMRAREGLLHSDVLGDHEDMKQILPIIREGGSDTATFDNVLEFLVQTGRSLPHAILMMIPEPWAGHESMSPELKAFYEYHSSLMEPWDGPAAIAFSDGTVIGAVLDRNGLRPSRYYVTKDDLVIMASEVGVLDIPAEDIVLKERLHPGRIFLVDTSKGRIVSDEEVKRELAAAHPYQDWLSNLIDIEDLDPAPYLPPPSHETVVQRQELFGYTHEDLRLLLGPMATNGEEALGSMGTDTSLAVLSDRPRLLYDYFKQVFAQVTNPPLDAIREELVTSMESTIGPEGNLLDPRPESCRQIKIKYPIIDNDQLAKLRHVYDPGFRAIRLQMLFDPLQDGPGLERAMEDLKRRASDAVEAGYTILILSDRDADRVRAPIPSLLATSGVHHHLVRLGTRTRCALVVESGDAREVHHCALLLGYGAGAVNPYLAFETLNDMIRQRMLVGITHEQAVKHYIKALNKGILKVMSKMGISTLQSYCGAQVFEAVGLDRAFVHKYFTRTASRIGGVGIDVVSEEVRRRHQRAFPSRPVGEHDLEWGGEYQWRRDGEYHLFNPDTVFKLQHSTRSGQYSIFKEYTKLVDDQSQKLATLRGLLELRNAVVPVPIDEVESVDSIVKRFATGAMSYGSISQEAHETLAIAMNRIGGKSNTGEGGEDPARYVADPERRLAPIGRQAGGLGPLRRDERVPRQRRRPADQDGAGRQARRRRPAAGPQGVPVDREGALRHAGRRPDLAAAAPRHLFDRGPRAAHLRPEERQPRGAHSRQARGARGRRHGGGRRGQGARRRRAHLGPRRRHGRLAAHVHQARRRALGARPRRDPAGPDDERPARPHHRAGGRTAQDRPRRRRGGVDGRRGVRLRDGAARGLGLHHDARLPPEHLPGGHRHAGSRAPEAVRRPGRVRRELLPVHRRRGARAHGGARLPHDGRDDRQGGPPELPEGRGSLESAGPRLLRDPPRAERPGRRAPPADAGAGSRPRRRRSTTRSSPRRSPRSSTARPCRSRSRSGTSTARWAPCSDTRSRSAMGARDCRTTRLTSSSPGRPARASGPSCRAASR